MQGNYHWQEAAPSCFPLRKASLQRNATERKERFDDYDGDSDGDDV